MQVCEGGTPAVVLSSAPLRLVGLVPRSGSTSASVTHREKPTSTAIPSHRHHVEASRQDTPSPLRRQKLLTRASLNMFGCVVEDWTPGGSVGPGHSTGQLPFLHAFDKSRTLTPHDARSSRTRFVTASFPTSIRSRAASANRPNEGDSPSGAYRSARLRRRKFKNHTFPNLSCLWPVREFQTRVS